MKIFYLARATCRIRVGSSFANMILVVAILKDKKMVTILKGKYKWSQFWREKISGRNFVREKSWQTVKKHWLKRCKKLQLLQICGFICTNPQQLPGGVISLRFVISFRWHWGCATDGTAAIPAKLPELGSRQFVVEPNLEWVEIKQREKGHQVLCLGLSQRVVWF